MSYYEILAVMMIAGVLGGTVNYGLARTEQSTWRDLGWSIVVGLGASLLVPLFLNTISSSLLSGLLNGSAGKADIFVFSGFCLLGAIASKAMIQTLTQRVLKEAEKARKEVETLKEEVRPIVVKETEPVSEPAPQEQRKAEDSQSSGFKMEAFGFVGNEPSLIIKALGNSKYSRRTATGIQKDTGVPLNKVLETLNWLEANGLAASSGSEVRYWGLTEKGRYAFKSILGN